MNSSWIPLDRIQSLIDFEIFVVALFFILSGQLFFKFILKNITEKRQNNLKDRFQKTYIFYSTAAIVAATQWLIFGKSDADYYLVKIGSYLAVVALFLGAITIIRIAQIYVYLYLFFSNMSHGVPRLIGNMFTFAFSIIIFGLIAAGVFSFDLTAVLTSSAIFSLILGLALQDTLGNLFSGVALQIDKPFEIGDWLEILQGHDRIIGQIQEITWRATYLIGFGDETILIPNRTISQSQMLIFSKNHRPPRFNQVMKIEYGNNLDLVKSVILQNLNMHESVLNDPEPRMLVMESNESWVLIKFFYSLKDYGLRYRVADQLLKNIIIDFEKHKIKLATNKMTIIQKIHE